MPYPDELDELEEIVDRSLVGGVWTPGTKWQASVVNPWITAINAIEETLGLNPEGAYSTVAERLGVLNPTWVPLAYVGVGDDVESHFGMGLTPLPDTLIVWLNKVIQIPGYNPLTDDYYYSEDAIWFYTPPPLGHKIYAHYAYIPVP